MRLRGIVVDRETVEINGKKQEVEILQTNFRSPLLAHWWEEGKSKSSERRLKEVWAVAHTVPELKPVLEGNTSIASASANALFAFDGLHWGAHCFTAATTPSEPDYLYCIHASTPNDPEFNLQREAFDRIHMKEAWAIQKGSGAVKVAIIDTGVAYRHPDLAANIAMRPDHKTVLGLDFHNGSPDPDDDHWHGTFCAGLIGAVGDNRLGLSGVCQRVSLLPLKALDSSGIGTSVRAAEAVRFAVNNGADVILCAWGSPNESSGLKKAIEEAGQKEVVVVASAGNSEAWLNDDHFPASFSASLSNVIAVGATDSNDLPLPSETMPDIFAPGEDVYSTFPPHLRYSPYHVGGGTSAAAAIVAGACALIKAELKKQKREMSAADIRQLLINSADSVNGSAVKRLNLEKALNGLTPPGHSVPVGPGEPTELEPTDPYPHEPPGKGTPHHGSHPAL